MKIPSRKPRDDQAPRQGRSRWKPTLRKPSWSWRKTTLITVGVLVIVWMGRGLVPIGTSGDTPDTAAPETAPKPPQRVIDLDGRPIPAEGGPVAVLNPGLARPGATVGVFATGFDPGATVSVLLSAGPGRPAEVASGKADRHGSVSAEFVFPAAAANAAGEHVVTVQQANSENVAEAELVAQAGVATAKLSDNTAAPGGALTVDASGFAPGETINVYWGRVAGEPSETLEADESGAVSRAAIQVGVGPTGDSSVILVGQESQSAAVAPFTMLALYPTAAPRPYSARAGESVSVTGKGFAPGERVLVYFNQAGGTPAFIGRSDARGNVGGVSFRIPFGLKGNQTLILVGEKSRASTSAGFSVAPYSPTARANTYGGLPGTTLTFFVKDFAPEEAVHVYVGRGQGSAGELVAAFRVDKQGTAAAAGSYVIPSNAQGKLTFTLVGAKSEGSTTTTVTVDKSDGAIQVPPQPKYELPPDLEE